MRTSTIRFALLLSSLALSRAVAAQDIPTFHAGQWGAEFTGGNWTNAGLMRFFNPRSALVLSASGSLSHGTSTPDGGAKSTSNSQSLFLALGVRRNTTVAPRVIATTELGANYYISRVKTTLDALGNPPYRQNQTNYGLYGEIGGQYFVTPHIALGTGAALGASFGSGRTESGGSGTDYRGLYVSTTLLPVRVSLYF